jgi:hypothetical protein
MNTAGPVIYMGFGTPNCRPKIIRRSAAVYPDYWRCPIIARTLPTGVAAKLGLVRSVSHHADDGTAGLLMSGIAVFAGIFLLAAWSIQGIEAANIFTYSGREIAQYPLGIYQKWVTRFFTLVIPFGCVNYLPLLFILDKVKGDGLLLNSNLRSLRCPKTLRLKNKKNKTG